MAEQPLRSPLLRNNTTPAPLHDLARTSRGLQLSVDLLDHMEKRQQDKYRYIKLRINAHRDHSTTTKSHYQKRVSFDTINIQYNDDDDYDDADDDGLPRPSYGRRETRDVFLEVLGGERGRSLLPGRRNLAVYSPTPSPSRRSLSPLPPGLDVSRLLALKPSYPTQPIITHRGCTFTKFHNDFENLYLQKLNNSEHGFLKPVLPLRVILVYISARKHTWVALDWVLRLFIEHGDLVIVVSAINHNFDVKRRRSSAFQSPPRVVASKTPRMRLRQRNRPEYVKFIAKNTMLYIMEVINPKIIAKVSVEIAEGKTKDVLKEMYKLYEPNLVCTGSKANTRRGAPLKSWLLSKLTDRLVKNFPLPVIAVPALNMAKFEADLEDSFGGEFATLQQMEFLSSSNSNTTPAPSELSAESAPVGSGDDSDRLSINSDASLSSSSSNGSYSSFDEILNLYKQYRGAMDRDLEELSTRKMGENYFVDIVKSISDKLAHLCTEIRLVDPDFKGKGAQLARAITGSNSFGHVPYKTKLLLTPVEQDTNLSPTNTNTLSYKEMKRNLKMKALQAQQQSSPPPAGGTEAPKINIESAESPVGPPKQLLRFVGLRTPNRHDYKGSAKLQKSFSHEVDLKSSRPALEPQKSHPDITTVLTPDRVSDDKQKKRKKFWRLFK